jgi:LEA14-like dessication related protein
MIFSRTTYRLYFRLSIIAIVLSSFLFGCKPFKSLEYKGVSDWNLQPKSFVESSLGAKVTIYNPNSYQITVKRIEANIEVNGSVWSKYSIDSSFVVPAESDFEFPIKLKVKNSSLLSGVSQIANGKDLNYLLIGTIKGTYRSITAEVPFKYSGSFNEGDIKF